VSFSTVRVERVSKRFGRAVALRGVSLGFEAGACTLLLGANGAGKTTLLNILATRSRPSRGGLFFGERRFEGDDPEIRSQIGLLSHGSLLYGELSTLENLRFFARLHGLAKPEARIAEVLRQVDLEAAKDRPVRACSRGMVQRAALARAILHSPRLLLLDEPLTGLDRASTERLRETLRAERARGCILVVITHQPRSLGSLCDRAVLLHDGRVLRDEQVGADPDRLDDVLPG